MENNSRTVYLAGKITGDPMYFTKFLDAGVELRKAGYTVLSPTVLPCEGFTHDQYMKVTCAMLEICDCVCFLDGWEDSKGARIEYGLAGALHKHVFTYEEFLRGMDEYTEETLYADDQIVAITRTYMLRRSKDAETEGVEHGNG